MGQGHRLLIAGFAAALITLQAGVGNAAALYYGEPSTYDIANNATMGDFMGCGAAGNVIGGGIFITGSSLGIEVKYSSPLDSVTDADARPDDGWEVWANNDASGADEKLTDYYICTLGRVAYRSERRTLALNTDRAVRVDCPPDTQLASGGLLIEETGDLQQEAVQMYPVDGPDADPKPDDRWVGHASNYAGGGPTEMTTTAVCSPTGDFVYPSATRNAPANLQVGDAVGCPGASQVTGGGMQITKPGNVTELASSNPDDDAEDADAKADDVWRAWVNNEGSRARLMTTWAICRKP